MRIFVAALFLLSCCRAFGHDLLLSGFDNNPGVLLFDSFRYDEAEAYFTLHKKKNGELAELANLYLAKLAVLKGQGERAVEHIKAALQTEPNASIELLLAAEAYCTKALQVSMFKALKMGRKCGSLYTEAAQQDPLNMRAQKDAILFHIDAPSMAGGSMKTARKLLQQLKAYSEEEARVVELYLIAEDETQKAALTRARSYSTLEFKQQENLYELALFFKEREFLEEAERLLVKLMDKQQFQQQSWYSHDTLFQLGELWIAQRETLDRGIASLQRYIALSNDVLDAHYFWSRWHLANAYKEKGDTGRYNELVADIQSHNYSFNEDFKEAFESARR